MSARARFGLVVALVALLAVGVRLVAASREGAIERDGVQYVRVARFLAAGDLEGALAQHYPPGYPALVAAVARVPGVVPGEREARVASALAGALLAIGAALAAARAYGARAGALAGVCAAVHATSVGLASQALGDAFAIGLDALAIACVHAGLDGRRRFLPLAGALAAAGYLVRPEGAVVLLALAVAASLPRASRTRRGRALDAALVLAPALLVALPYVAVMRERAVLGGGGEGRWKLTLKRDVLLEAGVERVFPVRDGGRGFDAGAALEVAGADLLRAAKQAAVAARELDPLGCALVVALLVAGVGSRARPLIVIHLCVVLWLLLAFCPFRVEGRWGTRVAALALPHVGAGLAALSRRAAARHARAPVALAALVVALWVPFAVRDRAAPKASWREVGDLLAARGARRVLAADPRPAFYAGADHVDLYIPLRNAGPGVERRARATLDLARTAGASAVVLGPNDRDLEPALATPLGVPQIIEREGAERIVVFLVPP